MDKRQIEQAELIKLGEECRSFKNSSIGIYLLNRANDEAGKSLVLLKDVNPDDTKKIRQLQSDIKRFDEFEKWLDEAIFEGDQAYSNYENEQNEV